MEKASTNVELMYDDKKHIQLPNEIGKKSDDQRNEVLMPWPEAGTKTYDNLD